MRLTAEQSRIVKQEVAHLFGTQASVRLFGSRTDDHSRGGDIDLIVSVPGDCPDSRQRALRLTARLQQRLGDQRIDVLVTDTETPDNLVHREALRNGTPL